MIIGEFVVSDCSKKTNYDGELDRLWLIVKSGSSHQFRRLLHDLNNDREIVIEKGTVFKLGRISLRVKNLRLEGSEAPNTPQEDIKPSAPKVTSK